MYRRFLYHSNLILSVQGRTTCRAMSTSQFMCNGPSKGDGNLLSVDTINPHIVALQYAVRGPIVIRAGQIEAELKSGAKKPFDKVIRANIGDCHAMGQQPITWIRQVISCCTEPRLLNDPEIPEDVKKRVKLLLSYCGGNSVGAYSESTGVEIIRRHCAEYIARRDGIETDWTNIALTTGASEGVRAILSLINASPHGASKPAGVMIPIPQYPLYSATITELGMHQISYYLNEDNEWQLSIDELERAIKEAKEVCVPKAIVVINPGNPTGAVLSKENIQDIIKFAQRHRLMIMADEVYQHNIYAEGAAFYSFKKTMHEMGVKLELTSFMSASKGYMGECGLRGGYVEITNFHPDVKAMLYKAFSARLCSSILGQIALDCIVASPQPGDPSYELHEKEKNQVLASLKERAKLAADTFNSMEGFKSNKVAGAMYAFPRITLPPKAIEAAKKANQAPDFFYCMKLLERYGICVVPGSGFGQIPGTYHFRTTILPQPDNLRSMMEKLRQFHTEFLAEYK